MGALPVCMPLCHVCSAQGHQMRVSGSLLELELELVVSFHVGAPLQEQ